MNGTCRALEAHQDVLEGLTDWTSSCAVEVPPVGVEGELTPTRPKVLREL